MADIDQIEGMIGDDGMIGDAGIIEGHHQPKYAITRDKKNNRTVSREKGLTLGDLGRLNKQNLGRTSYTQHNIFNPGTEAKNVAKVTYNPEILVVPTDGTGKGAGRIIEPVKPKQTQSMPNNYGYTQEPKPVVDERTELQKQKDELRRKMKEKIESSKTIVDDVITQNNAQKTKEEIAEEIRIKVAQRAKERLVQRYRARMKERVQERVRARYREEMRRKVKSRVTILAKEMLNQNSDMDLIIKRTGLKEPEILEIREKMMAK